MPHWTTARYALGPLPRAPCGCYHRALPGPYFLQCVCIFLASYSRSDCPRADYAESNNLPDVGLPPETCDYRIVFEESSRLTFSDREAVANLLWVAISM